MHKFEVVFSYCLETYAERLDGSDKNIKTFPCPTCRSEIMLKSNQDVACLASNHFIKSMLEIIALQEKAKASPKCSHCKDPAINHCGSCEMFMCEKCSDSHNIWPGNKNHNVLSVEELSKPDVQMKMKRNFIARNTPTKYWNVTVRHAKNFAA